MDVMSPGIIPPDKMPRTGGTLSGGIMSGDIKSIRSPHFQGRIHRWNVGADDFDIFNMSSGLLRFPKKRSSGTPSAVAKILDPPLVAHYAIGLVDLAYSVHNPLR